LGVVIVVLLTGLGATLASVTTAAAEAPFVVTAQANGSRVEVGDSVRLTGAVVPNPGAGQRVLIQRKIRGEWRTIRTRATDAAGRYAATLRLTERATYQLRAHKPRSATRGGDVSRTIRVRALAWRYLDQLYAAVGGEGDYDREPVHLNGTLYRRSFVSDYCGYNDRVDEHYNLGRRHRRFRAVVGMSDVSEPGHTYHLQVIGDAAVLWEGDVTLGVATRVNVSVRDVLRLRLVVEGDVDCGYQAWGAFGNPQLQW
jgi:hypothetical protein